MAQVEIFWPPAVPPETLLGAEAELQQAGIETTSRQRKVSRGAEVAVLVFVSNTVLGPMLKRLFEHLGESACDALQKFVGRILSGPSKEPAGPAPNVVVFRSASTGAEFLFTSGLPDEAFRKAIEFDDESESGRWVWDQGSRAWLRFEPAAGQGGNAP
jgi:hypothetical protein